MSKGNGRSNKNGQGNGMDKFNGTCNGVNSKAPDQLNQLDFDSNQRKPNAIDSKAGNFKFKNSPDKSIKEFKNKIK